MEKLESPNKNLSDAVRVRQEIDLRMGASFTRFQSLSFRHIVSPQSKLVLSYGPCQFPTLGFLVERQRQIDDFVPEPFWYLSVHVPTDTNSKKKNQVLELSWRENRMSCQQEC